MMIAVVALPTQGYMDRRGLETYEELSEESFDFDLFRNLTFRFSCEDRPIGLYADPDYDCRVFHACDDSGKGFPVICPNNTVFDQKERVCTDEALVDCEHADEWFYLNELPYSIELIEENGTRSAEGEEIPSVLPLLLS
ncbi:uncharacterized protein LOC116433788 [Nomia melanderi]|uniref:uncharacterized protein LOC116433788 n=1 Tax=Nomia melanderi TaxID=2448451 RepID=UPI0013042671|nr:uncharacterized protein LOC116433788 [Nomia melanderi]